jgi:hypothetical protein
MAYKGCGRPPSSPADKNRTQNQGKSNGVQQESELTSLYQSDLEDHKAASSHRRVVEYDVKIGMHMP